MSVLAEVVLLRNFRGEIKINTPGNKQLQDDDQKTSEGMELKNSIHGSKQFAEKIGMYRK